MLQEEERVPARTSVPVCDLHFNPDGDRQQIRCLATYAWPSRRTKNTLEAKYRKVEIKVKVKPSVKKICEKCKIIKRHGHVMVICENPKHKQRQG